MCLDGFLAQLVAFESATRGRRRVIILAGAGVADAQHRPVAGRDIPRQTTLGVHLGGQIHRARTIPELAVRRFAFGQFLLPQQCDLRHLNIPVLLALMRVGGEENDAEISGPDFIKSQPQLLPWRQGGFLDRPEALAVLRALDLDLLRAAIGVGEQIEPCRRPGLVIIELEILRLFRGRSHAGFIAVGNPARVAHPVLGEGRSVVWVAGSCGQLRGR